MLEPEATSEIISSNPLLLEGETKVLRTAQPSHVRALPEPRTGHVLPRMCGCFMVFLKTSTTESDS